MPARQPPQSLTIVQHRLIRPQRRRAPASSAPPASSHPAACRWVPAAWSHPHTAAGARQRRPARPGPQRAASRPAPASRPARRRPRPPGDRPAVASRPAARSRPCPRRLLWPPRPRSCQAGADRGATLPLPPSPQSMPSTPSSPSADLAGPPLCTHPLPAGAQVPPPRGIYPAAHGHGGRKINPFSFLPSSSGLQPSHQLSISALVSGAILNSFSLAHTETKAWVALLLWELYLILWGTRTLTHPDLQPLLHSAL